MARAKKETKEAVAVEAEVEEVQKQIIPKEIDPSMMITVKNGFQGRLIYKSSRTGEVYAWEGFGSEQELELRELRSAKNSQKKFFVNNWFMFDEEYVWVLDYLGVRQYYKHAVSLKNFDKIFSKTPAEIIKTISEMSAGQKKSMVYRARQAIVDGEIDSNKAIAALEKALGVELIEH